MCLMRLIMLFIVVGNWGMKPPLLFALVTVYISTISCHFVLKYRWQFSRIFKLERACS